MDGQNTVQLHLLGAARRAPMNQDEFDTKFNYMKGPRNRRISLDSRQVECCVCCRLNVKAPYRLPQTEAESSFPRSQLLLNRYFPFLEWWKLYDFRKNLPGDLYAGVSVGFHSIAQGFSFSFLAGLPLICGLYTTFFAALLYTFFGTSKMSFLGCHVIICFFVRNVVERHSIPYDFIYLLSSNSTELPEENGFDQIYTVSTLTFIASLIQAILYALRLDFLFSYISQQVLSGFSFGLAVRIAFNQLQHVLHVKGNSCISELSFTLSHVSAKTILPTYKQCAFLAAKNSILNKTAIYGLSAYLRDDNPVIYKDENCVTSVWDCFEYINLYTMALSACIILFIIFARQILSPLLQMRVNSPIPFEFFLMIFACFMSELLDMKGKHQVETVKNMQRGFMITLPRISLFDNLFVDAFALSLLTFASHTNLAFYMAKEHKYSIDPQMEQITFSAIGIISSLFGAHPCGQSLTRNSMAFNAGTKSLLTNIFVVIIILPFIFILSSFFSSLPVCVFSCIIFAALWESFGSLSNFAILWKVSKLDVATWIFSCIITAFSYNSSYALFSSAFFALCTIIVRTQWPKFQLLVNVTGSGAYYAERNYYGSELLEESGVAVMRFEAPLLFNNSAQFKKDVISVAENIRGQILGVGIGTRTGSMKSANAASIAGTKDIPMRSTLLISGDIVPNYDTVSADTTVNKVVIIDFSAISIIDASGLEAMIEIHTELSDRKFKLLFASVNANIRNRFKDCGGFEIVSKSSFFPSVHDAVLYSQQLGGVIAPSIHMSVSMNGCRDLITLSTATSNHDFEQGSNANAVVNANSYFVTDMSATGTAPRPSLPETRVSPPPVSPIKLRATTSNGN